MSLSCYEANDYYCSAACKITHTLLSTAIPTNLELVNERSRYKKLLIYSTYANGFFTGFGDATVVEVIPAIVIFVLGVGCICKFKNKFSNNLVTIFF
jgi:hypothetical protein